MLTDKDLNPLLSSSDQPFLAQFSKKNLVFPDLFPTSAFYLKHTLNLVLCFYSTRMCVLMFVCVHIHVYMYSNIYSYMLNGFELSLLHRSLLTQIVSANFKFLWLLHQQTYNKT